jgi:trimeric autotransporter adhesin
LPDGSTVVVPAGRLLYFNPKAFRNRVLYTPIPGRTGTQVVNDPYFWGTSGRFLPQLRGLATNNWNMTVSREFRIGERVITELRCEALNVFNRKQFSDASITKAFGSANVKIGDPGVGQSTSTTFGTIDITQSGRSPRYLQLSMRISF